MARHLMHVSLLEEDGVSILGDIGLAVDATAYENWCMESRRCVSRKTTWISIAGYNYEALSKGDDNVPNMKLIYYILLYLR